MCEGMKESTCHCTSTSRGDFKTDLVVRVQDRGTSGNAFIPINQGAEDGLCHQDRWLKRKASTRSDMQIKYSFTETQPMLPCSYGRGHSLHMTQGLDFTAPYFTSQGFDSTPANWSACR